jgi:hypothetical protein
MGVGAPHDTVRPYGNGRGEQTPPRSHALRFVSERWDTQPRHLPYFLPLCTNVVEGVFFEGPQTLFPAHMYILLWGEYDTFST